MGEFPKNFFDEEKEVQEKKSEKFYENTNPEKLDEEEKKAAEKKEKAEKQEQKEREKKLKELIEKIKKIEEDNIEKELSIITQELNSEALKKLHEIYHSKPEIKKLREQLIKSRENKFIIKDIEDEINK